MNEMTAEQKLYAAAEQQVKLHERINELEEALRREQKRLKDALEDLDEEEQGRIAAEERAAEYASLILNLRCGLDKVYEEAKKVIGKYGHPYRRERIKEGG